MLTQKTKEKEKEKEKNKELFLFFFISHYLHPFVVSVGFLHLQKDKWAQKFKTFSVFRFFFVVKKTHRKCLLVQDPFCRSTANSNMQPKCPVMRRTRSPA